MPMLRQPQATKKECATAYQSVSENFLIQNHYWSLTTSVQGIIDFEVPLTETICGRCRLHCYTRVIEDQFKCLYALR